MILNTFFFFVSFKNKTIKNTQIYLYITLQCYNITIGFGTQRMEKFPQRNVNRKQTSTMWQKTAETLRCEPRQQDRLHRMVELFKHQSHSNTNTTYW